MLGAQCSFPLTVVFHKRDWKKYHQNSLLFASDTRNKSKITWNASKMCLGSLQFAWVNIDYDCGSNTCQTVAPASCPLPTPGKKPQISNVGRPDLQLCKAGKFKANISSLPPELTGCVYWNQDNRYWVIVMDWAEIFHQQEPSSHSRWLCGKKNSLGVSWQIKHFCPFMFLA